MKNTKKGTDAQRHPRQTIGQITGAEFQTKQVKKKIGTSTATQSSL